jgi:hypothetical protein
MRWPDQAKCVLTCRFVRDLRNRHLRGDIWSALVAALSPLRPHSSLGVFHLRHLCAFRQPCTRYFALSPKKQVGALRPDPLPRVGEECQVCQVRKRATASRGPFPLEWPACPPQSLSIH